MHIHSGITWVGLGTTIGPYGINRGFSVKWINELGKYFMGVHGELNLHIHVTELIGISKHHQVLLEQK